VGEDPANFIREGVPGSLSHDLVDQRFADRVDAGLGGDLAHAVAEGKHPVSRLRQEEGWRRLEQDQGPIRSG
jgi:hypothetical protein